MNKPKITKIDKDKIYEGKHSYLFRDFIDDKEVTDKIEYIDMEEHTNGSVAVRVIFKQNNKPDNPPNKETQFDKNSDANKVKK